VRKGIGTGCLSVMFIKDLKILARMGIMKPKIEKLEEARQ